jgi:phosphohistidine phosphatase
MKLYLMQHGDALAKDIDPDRSLSETGLADVERVASFLTGRIEISRVMHSGKTRARQTAEFFERLIVSEQPGEAISGIKPNDSVEAFAQQVENWNEDTLVVGHLPFMAKLVSWLVTGSADASIVSYRPGSIVCLETTEDGHWQVQWIIRPELLTTGTTAA